LLDFLSQPIPEKITNATITSAISIRSTRTLSYIVETEVVVAASLEPRYGLRYRNWFRY